MNWLSQNWFFLLVVLLFASMHLGHGSHGGRGGHGGHGSRGPARPGDRDGGSPPREPDETARPTGHQH